MSQNQTLTTTQAARQDETVATQWQGAAAAPVNPNTGTVPDVYQRMNLANQVKADSPFNPPSTGEIHQQMWVGSFMMALMSGLATGNAGAAVVGGMWAAIGIHDYGNTLRQRAKSVPQLQKDGYSERAILKWYQDGDNAELDKEQSMFERRAEHADTVQHQKDEMAQQREFHNDEITQHGLDRAQQQKNADRAYGIQSAQLNITQQNADSNRIEAIAKMGGQAGGIVGQTAVDSGQPHLQNASFDPSKVPMPAGSEQWSDKEKAAYIYAAGQAYHAAQLKEVLHQEAAAKNLRTSESQQTGMYDKILTAAQKVNQTPNNKAGDEQLLMQFQVGESPNVSPRTAQIKPLMKSMNTGFWDNLYGGAKDLVGQGMTDSEREQARELTRENATAQAESHMEHVQNVVTTGGYDLSNPQVMADMVAAFHVSPQTIIGLANGSLSPQDAAAHEIDKVSPRTTNFADVKVGNDKKATSGSW